MNHASKKKLLETDPQQLASLIGGDDDAIGERIWNSNELAAILRHQMSTPLQVDLAGVGGAAGRLKEEAAAGGLLLKSFGDLLSHPHPPLALLNMMKDFAKACRISPASALPREISSIIYFASILVAMTRRSRRITKLTDGDLRQALRWALAQPWLDDITRTVFLEGEQFLASTAPAVSENGASESKPEFLNKGWAVHRFLTEARHMYKMSHPAIIRVLDVSDRPEGPYFVMPYMAGGSLAEKINLGEALQAETILPVVRAVAEALQHAHTRGITHRDLKPSNILLDAEGKAHLADFGLLRTFHNDTIIDAGQPQMEGTVPYMSPAVAAGKAEDTRSDIYSFGCLLYEMLTGQPPYQGPTVDAVLKQIQDGPPPPIRQINPHAPAALAALADHAMARELRDRYASMGDVVAELERAAQAKLPTGPHGKASGSPNRRKTLIAAGVVALVSLAAFGISQLSFWKSSENVGGTSTPNTATRATPAGKIAPGTGKIIDLGGGVHIEFVLIHPGSFMMGSDKGTTAIEGVPIHKVTLTKPFYLGKYEVTQEQWEKITGSNRSLFKGPKNPVDSVSGGVRFSVNLLEARRAG